MRKLVLVVIALVLAALVWLFARTLAPSTAPAPDTVAPKTGSQASTELDPLVDSGSNKDSASRSALESALAPTNASNAASTTGPGLRVVVRFAGNAEHVPKELDVRVLDLLGEEHPGQREHDNAFRFSGLSADTYAIEVTEAESMRAVQRVKLEMLSETKVVEMTLTPTRSVKVRWTTSDGRPIAKAVLDSGLQDPLLTVIASHIPLHQDDAGSASLIVDSIQASIRNRRPFDEEDGPWPERSNGITGTGEGLLDLASDPSDPGLFCTFEIRTSADLWLSAWYRGRLLDSQMVARDQTEMRFTSSLEPLHSLLVPVSLRLVDDVTGEPLSTATVSVRGQASQRRSVDEQGRCAFSIEPGRTSIDIEPGYKLIALDTRRGSPFVNDVEAGGGLIDHAWSKSAFVLLNVLARSGEALELGDIRVPRVRALRFRVLDVHMRPAVGAQVELIRKRSYDRVTGERDVQQASSDGQGLAVFQAAANETYLVACHFIHLGSFDSEPLIVDASAVRDDPATVAAEVTLRPIRKVSIAFDPAPRPGASVLIETAYGLPVTSQVLDQFGLCVIGLGGLQYQLRLVEDGQVRLTLPFSVTSDPFVLAVQR